MHGHTNFWLVFRRSLNTLRVLVPFVIFKKSEKHPWRSVTFSLLKVALLHGCFSRFLNCTNKTKLRKASDLIDQIMLRTSENEKLRHFKPGSRAWGNFLCYYYLMKWQDVFVNHITMRNPSIILVVYIQKALTKEKILNHLFGWAWPGMSRCAWLCQTWQTLWFSDFKNRFPESCAGDGGL